MLKSDIRKELKKKREILTLNEKNELSKKIAQIVTKNFNLDNKIISIFLPIERLNEVNTAFLIEDLQNLNAVISSPVSDFNSFELKHIIYNDKTVLKINELGIPEPANGDEIKPEAFDCVFVPLLAINKNGNRVGYGKGFYDRFLAQCGRDTIFVGLNFFDELVNIEDINKDDVPIHYVATPNKVLKF
jgi:5-formyltetrahydrofolate cyclo-ligase